MDLCRNPALLGDWRASQAPLYAALATALQGLLLRGELLPGDRLPPERALADALGLSRSTVVAAYGRLAEGGWVQARQGQGTTVSAGPPGHVARRRRAQPLGNPALQASARGRGESESAAANWIDFSLATALPDLAWISPSEASRQLALRESAYQPEGMWPLRERIAARYRSQGLATTADQIIVCAGAQQALSLLSQLYLSPGDRVLLECPNYFGAIDVFRSSGARLHAVPVQAHCAHASNFIAAAASAPKLIYLCPQLHNPSGQSWPASRSQALLRTVQRAGSSLLVIDDSLAELHFSAEARPLKAPPDAAVVHIGSLSKSLWAGLRIGWLRAPQAMIEPLRHAKACADIASSSLSAAIACDLFDRMDRLLQPRRASLQHQAQQLQAALHEHLPGWSVKAPEGGLFLWAQLPAQGPRAEALCEAAQQVQLRLTPGTAMSVSPERGQDHVRLAFTLPEAQALAGVQRLAALGLY